MIKDLKLLERIDFVCSTSTCSVVVLNMLPTLPYLSIHNIIFNSINKNPTYFWSNLVEFVGCFTLPNSPSIINYISIYIHFILTISSITLKFKSIKWRSYFFIIIRKKWRWNAYPMEISACTQGSNSSFHIICHNMNNSVILIWSLIERYKILFFPLLKKVKVVNYTFLFMLLIILHETTHLISD